jgi:hypothetical protein
MNVDLIKEKLESLGFLGTANMMGITLNRVLEIVDVEYKTFKDLEFTPTEEFLSGVRSTCHFDNGYGVSVVRHKFSYGNKLDLFELAIIDKVGDMVYSTPITDDVLGYLSEDEVSDTMIKVQRLDNNPYIFK